MAEEGIRSPLEDEPMEEMTPEVAQQIHALIRVKTGAKAIILLLSDAEIPCKDFLEGQGCGHLQGHQIHVHATGVADGLVPRTLEICAMSQRARGLGQ